jgi:hypothetical protein
MPEPAGKSVTGKPDGARPNREGKPWCSHASAVPVFTLVDEPIAYLCSQCDAQLEAPPQILFDELIDEWERTSDPGRRNGIRKLLEELTRIADKMKSA